MAELLGLFIVQLISPLEMYFQHHRFREDCNSYVASILTCQKYWELPPDPSGAEE